MGRYLGVKDAALALGVHPQTVRGWTRRGLLAAIRLPGSGYRRYSAAELDRVKGLMRGGPRKRTPLTLEDPLFELDGTGDSGCSDTVDRLHEAVSEAIEWHETRLGSESPPEAMKLPIPPRRPRS